MDYGIALATHAESWKHVKRAEELGYASASFFDTQLLNADLFVAMGAAAMATKTIKLTTGVLIPSNRIAPVAASALGSLNQLAPGRIEFGISTGFTGRRTMGLKRVKQADMKEYIRRRPGPAGRRDAWNGSSRASAARSASSIPRSAPSTSRTRFRSTSPRRGRRSRALVAELGAGWICPLGPRDVGDRCAWPT